MSVTQLIDLILINPTVHLAPSYRDTGLTASYTFEPLSNLVYTRDQQVGGWGGVGQSGAVQGGVGRSGAGRLRARAAVWRRAGRE
jgi:hypothetical protein